MNKTIGMLAAAGGLSLCVAATPVGAQESPSSTLSKFFGSVVSGAGSEIGSTAVGWALSAIGVSNSTGQALADLTEIITLLKDIEAALQTIETDFDNLACETAQDSTALQNATTAIGGLYSRYTQFVNDYNTDQTIPPWGGTQGVQQWLSDIFEPETGVQAQLIAIQNNLIEAGNTGVIFECVKFITDQYNSSDGPKTNVFDDAYYAQVQQLTNFYYLYQSYAAALLVEAWHVQACLDSDGTTTGSDRNCTFDGQTAVTPQSGVTSDTAYNICNNPPNTRVAGDCTNAQTALTNLNDNGAYDGMSAQLIQAGAPYTNDVNPLVAKGWFTDAVFVRSLEDFTNNATANGSKIQSTSCATPLTSADPCGFTVGAYNLEMPNGGKVTYGGYEYWVFVGGTSLSQLLTT
jgi:hypothetical protein